ncbi:precorrin-6A synthase (deacetylating) [Hoyosella sp. G463]|uniref:Precorrin-6A synthase (Deacetylating) n=1 Tax=Lolliginicoccus lacisalsi TaxID=2742202 RepID=A0A927PM52_9ACTN|nr:precorrin-6A synthase (deacetylating) [Lolliginicoccus lacisalsi]MBD8506077.1 precorrin-6A synthase (deacetylating) [Lolliginicoccus lacisalsi]
MRTLLVIGIGAGDPQQLTLQAIDAIKQTDVFLIVDKGDAKRELVDLRRALLDTHRPDGGYAVVEIDDPQRDRIPDDYQHAVTDWHARRAALFADTIATAVPENGTGAFLVWGDPTLYDSILRILERVQHDGRLPLAVEVVPGITSIQALAARHRIPLNRIGEPIHITTGRQLARGLPAGITNAVVMLDAHHGYAALEEREPGSWHIWWGANLGTRTEQLIAGPIAEAAPMIARAREAARDSAGWVMDTYLVRRAAP